MMSWEHGGGFSLDASGRIEAKDRAGLERLLRRPSALRTRTSAAAGFQEHSQVTALAQSDPSSQSRVPAQSEAPPVQPEALLTPLNPSESKASPLPHPQQQPLPQPGQQPPILPSQQPSDPPVDLALKPRRPGSAPLLWARLLARIYEGLPLACPFWGGTLRIISFITDAPPLRHLLEPIGEPTDPPRFSPPPGAPVWNEDVPESDGDPWVQPAPDDDFDQSVSC